MEFLESGWKQPDEGIWEVRGPRRHFTHSKVMAGWRRIGRSAPSSSSARWGPVDFRGVRSTTRLEQWVLEHGVDDRGVFVQYEGTRELDASLLTVPLVGFLPGDERSVRAHGGRRSIADSRPTGS